MYALGLEDSLVGISHECDYPPSAALRLPRLSRVRFDPAGLTSAEIDAAVRAAMMEFGSVYEVDRGLLRQLQPDLVLTQGVCEVCAVPTGSVMDAISELPIAPRVLSLDAHTLEDIVASVEEVADATGEADRGKRLAAELRERLRDVGARVQGLARPRVLMLEWLDPPFIPGHWVPEMLAIAGGNHSLGPAGERSREVGWTELHGDPDVLLVEPCGMGLGATRAEADRMRNELDRIAARAIRERRAWLLHSSYFSRSGPRVVEGVELLASILHPEAFPDATIADRAELWPGNG